MSSELDRDGVSWKMLDFFGGDQAADLVFAASYVKWLRNQAREKEWEA